MVLGVSVRFVRFVSFGLFSQKEGLEYRDLVKRFRSYTAKHGGYVMDVAELADMDVREWLDQNGFLA